MARHSQRHSYMIIRTPDQRLRVFVSSTLQEVAEERIAAREAITRLRLSPVMFELGARPHPPQDLYRAYLEQSHIFIGIYWERYGWVAPDMDISGLEDEYRLCGSKPRLIYVKTPAPNREPRLKALLDRIRNDDTASYKPFSTAAELQQLIENDLAILLTERFEMTQANRVDESADTAHRASAPRVAISRTDNLPTPSTPLVGREDEIKQISDTLLRSDVRLVTLFGPGGIGKTRLAVEVGRSVAEQFAHGVCFVPLSNISDHNLVVPAIGEALGLGETRSVGLSERVTDALRDKHMLLILDNFEQVLPAAPLVADLLTTAPKLELIVTSRAVLRVRGEFECAVHPLALPQPRSSLSLKPLLPVELRKSPAVQLFEARAQALKPSFEITSDNAGAVAELCARLDGLPLAIELAAARVKLLSPQAILARMIESEKESLRLLSGGARDLPTRQQTLQNTLDWSYGLLDKSEQALFARLSVFADGWTLASAAAVCGFDSDEMAVMDTMASLADKSLITHAPEEDDNERFAILNTIRDYAAGQLAANGEARDIRKRHADYFVEMTGRAESELKGARQRESLMRLERENSNVQAALDWLIENGDSETAVQMGWSLLPYWLITSRLSEALRWMTAALSRLDVSPSADGSKPTPPCVEARARALAIAGFAAAWQGNTDWASFLLSEAEALSDRISDLSLAAMTSAGVAITAMSQRELTTAKSRFETSFKLYCQANDRWSAAMVLNGIERIASLEGDYATTERVHTESQQLAQSLGDKVSMTLSTYEIGRLALLRGDVARAESQFRETVQLAQDAGYREGVAYGLEGLAAVANACKEGGRAAQLLGAAHNIRNLVGAPIWQWYGAAQERLLGEARTQAGSTFDSAWAQGASMTMDQAVEIALTQATQVQGMS